MSIGDVALVNETSVAETAKVDVPVSVCAAYTGGVLPVLTQSCFSKPCSTYDLQYGDWSDCSASCGGGTQTRSAT